MGDLIPVADTAALPPRPHGAHKGDFGTVIVVGGCATMIGAPALAAGAALRGGAGLVKVATAAALVPFVLTIEPSATAIALAGEVAADLRAVDAADAAGRAVLAAGPGLGREAGMRDLTRALWRGPRPLVLDADGLNALAEAPEWLRAGPPAGSARVMTPHPGEFQRLAAALDIRPSPVDAATRPAAAAELARACRAVVLLKGAGTVVSDGQRLYVNDTGNPALATAGSGDVLTGLVAALLAQGLDPFAAAALGARLHGLAADRWAARHGPSGLTARDLLAELPDAAQAYRGQKGMSSLSG